MPSSSAMPTAAFAAGDVKSSLGERPENRSIAPSGASSPTENPPLASHRTGCPVFARAIPEKTTIVGAEAPPAAEGPALEPGHGTFGLPIRLGRPAHRGKLRGGGDAIKFEAGVPDVHVEVNPELAPCANHRLREDLGGDVLAVKVGDEILARETDARARRVH